MRATRRKQDGSGNVIRMGGAAIYPAQIRQKTDPEVLTWAVDLAADMEMGYYVSPQNVQWEARPFVVAQLMRHLGYAEPEIRDGVPRPWYPGIAAFRRLVALKVLIRRASVVAIGGGAPWLDAAAASAAEELLRRLLVTPEDIGSRELVDLTTKLARMAEERRHRGFAAPPGSKGVVRSRTFERITETMAEFEDPADRARYAQDYERILARARAALPEAVAESTQPMSETPPETVAE